MSLIFRLSKFILVPILTEWIKLIDFLRLDGSINNKDRQTLEALRNEYPHKFESFTFTHRIKLSIHYFQWATRRNVSPTNRYIMCGSFIKAVSNESILSLFSLWKPRVKSELKQLVYSHMNNHVFHITLSYCTSSSISIICKLLRQCVRLEELTLSDNAAEFNEIVDTVGAYCPQLLMFNMKGNLSAIEANTMRKLIINCQHMKEFHVLNLPDVSIFHLTGPISMALIAHARHLTGLTLNGLPDTAFYHNWLIFLPKLTTVSVTFTNNLLATYLSYTSSTATTSDGCQLTSLRVINPYIISDDGIQWIGKYCGTHLTSLDISKCYIGYAMLMELARQLPLLKVLQASQCINFNHLVMESFAIYCPLLETLCVSSGELVDLCLNLTSLTIIHMISPIRVRSILSKCCKLLELDINCQDTVDLPVQMSLLGQQLQFIRGTYCTLDLPTAQSLATHCPMLREISVRSDDYDASPVFYLLQHLKFIRSLHLNVYFSAADLLVLIPSFSVLHEVHLITYITPALVKKIVKECSKLSVLHIEIGGKFKVFSMRVFKMELAALNPDLVLTLEGYLL